MATPAFDPLVDFDGLWTPELADRYLPIPGVPPAKYECLDGKLIMSPSEGTANIFAAYELAKRMETAAEVSGHFVYLTVNVRLGVQRWIEPDFTVLRRSGDDRVWIPAEDVLLAGECVSPSSKRNDRLDKPELCAEAGIPYFMLVEVNRRAQHARIELLRLQDGKYRTHASAAQAERFETELPFTLSFSPTELLER